MDKASTDLRAWVVTADMGLGHQRAAYPLRDIAFDGILSLGESEGTSEQEMRLWNTLRNSYEALSRLKSLPLIGGLLFKLVDTLQNIPPFYPMRDMSAPTYQVGLVKRLLDRGLCQAFLETVKKEPLPIVSTYFAPAVAADRTHHSANYCVLTDAEINRVWVSEDPRTSRIHYLAPCGRTVQRLKSYGIPDERIFLTGFPLPAEVLGGPDLDVLRADCGQRLNYLDPDDQFWPLHGASAHQFLGRPNCKPRNDRVLTITFAVGGAGAQTEIGVAIAESLREEIEKGRIRLNLVAGVRSAVKEEFETAKRELLPDSPGLQIVYGETKDEYFERFNQMIRTTDVLWTKPSELSFYCALGLPVIMAPNIGSQEEYNRRWLTEIQAGISQEDPRYTHQWLLDLLHAGRLAEAAWDGFLKARKYGTYKIREVLATGVMVRETSPLKR